MANAMERAEPATALAFVDFVEPAFTAGRVPRAVRGDGRGFGIASSFVLLLIPNDVAPAVILPNSTVTKTERIRGFHRLSRYASQAAAAYASWSMRLHTIELVGGVSVDSLRCT